MNDILKADVAGLAIFGRPDPRRSISGLFFGPDGFEGWDDGVDMRRDVIVRPNAPGSFTSDGELDSRVVSFSGVAIAPNPQALLQHGRRLRGVLAGGGLGRVSVTRHGVTEWAMGGLSGKPTFVVRGRTPWVADWQLQLWFPDPRKYGARVSFPITGPGVAQVIYHRGNFDAAPELIVRGDMPRGYSIEGPGSTYVVTRPVTADRPHVIDNATGLLSINGIVQFGAIASGTGWVIAAGSRPVTHKLVPAAGTGTLETRIRPTSL